MTDQEKIAQLLYKHSQGTIRAEEWEQLQEWVRSSPNNQYLFNRLNNGETLDAGLSEFHPNNKKSLGDQVWTSISQQLPGTKPAAAQETLNETTDHSINIERDQPAYRKLFFTKWRAAAAAILLLASGYVFFFNNKGSGSQDQVVVQTFPAENKQILLPDGSEVKLSANTTLEYASDFKNQRDIIFSGEGFFKVTKDPGHPFKIMLPDNLVVEVVGTSFNINSYHNAISTSLLVTEGVVKVHKGEALLGTLTKGEQIIYNRTSASAVITTKTINERTEDSSSAAMDVWTYDAMSISDLSALLNNQFGISLINKTGKNIYSATDASLNFNKQQSPQEIVAVFCSVTHYKYQWIDERTVILQ
ncbi:MAG: FecR domain-containing protein [Chitinophagaceae bacterium]|nr:FecR domain-containing protein [Chitinophagaceae bacterium]